MSKLDASLLLVTPCEVDPIATVQHALQLHQQELKSAGVEGFVHIASSYHDLKVGRVFLDPSRLLQVLINLLTNAIKLYVPAGSRFTLIIPHADKQKHSIPGGT
jgi:signal transduction histidine kinase